MQCCKLHTLKKSDNLDKIWPRKNYRGRAGSIIHDSATNSYLLVQSYSNRWGFPKGHIEGDETTYETAQRELKEETGIDLPLEIFQSAFTRRISQSTYFLIDLRRDSILLPSIGSLEDDITGIAWVHYNCLKEYERIGIVKLNYDARRYLKHN